MGVNGVKAVVLSFMSEVGMPRRVTRPHQVCLMMLLLFNQFTEEAVVSKKLGLTEKQME